MRIALLTVAGIAACIAQENVFGMSFRSMSNVDEGTETSTVIARALLGGPGSGGRGGGPGSGSGSASGSGSGSGSGRGGAPPGRGGGDEGKPPRGGPPQPPPISDECKALVESTCSDCVGLSFGREQFQCFKTCIEANVDVLADCLPSDDHSHPEGGEGGPRNDTSPCHDILAETCPDCAAMSRGYEQKSCFRTCAEANAEVLADAGCDRKPPHNGTENAACKALVEATCADCVALEGGPEKFECFKSCFDENESVFEDADCKPRPSHRVLKGGRGGGPGGNNNKNGGKGGGKGGKGPRRNETENEACKTLAETTCPDCAAMEKGKEQKDCFKECIRENNSTFIDAGCEGPRGGGDKGSGDDASACKDFVDATCVDCAALSDGKAKGDCIKTCFEENKDAFEAANCKPPKGKGGPGGKH